MVYLNLSDIKLEPIELMSYVKVNILGTILGLVYSVALVIAFGLPGALINAVTFQSVVFFITLYVCRKEHWLRWGFFKEKYDRIITQKYLGYSAMTLTTLALLPVSQMILRGYVISEISVAEAGIWEGMNRISQMYLGVITTAFSIYYLPRLSEIQDNRELHNEVFRCYKFIIPMLLLIGSAIFFLRHFLLWLLFTPAFYPMENLFIWQLIGDFFKISSWLLSYIMVAKAKATMFIICEIVFDLTYLLFCFICLRYNGIIGLTQGYLINYILYLVFMVYAFRNVIIVKA